MDSFLDVAILFLGICADLFLCYIFHIPLEGTRFSVLLTVLCVIYLQLKEMTRR